MILNFALLIWLSSCSLHQCFHCARLFSKSLSIRANALPTDVTTDWINGLAKKRVDSICEEARRKVRRTVYTSNDWKLHRSSTRYFSQLLSMPRSYVYRSLSSNVSLITLNAFFVVLYNKLVIWYKWPLPLLSVAALPFTLTSSALGLLLVFRTNTAYSRWKDARIAWATLSSKSSSLVRQAMSMFSDKDKVLKSEMLRYVVAFTVALKWRLRHPNSDNKLREYLSSVLQESEVQDVVSYQYRTHRIASKLTEIMKRANLLPNFFCHIDKGICDMVDAAFVCERIYTTPIPLVYTRHTARVLFLWLLTLPMSLYHVLDINKWAAVPISFFNAMLLFGIEELGVQIEEPFSILALDYICDEIQGIVRESQSLVVPPPPAQPVDAAIPPAAMSPTTSAAMLVVPSAEGGRAGNASTSTYLSNEAPTLSSSSRPSDVTAGTAYVVENPPDASALSSSTSCELDPPVTVPSVRYSILSLGNICEEIEGLPKQPEKDLLADILSSSLVSFSNANLVVPSPPTSIPLSNSTLSTSIGSNDEG